MTDRAPLFELLNAKLQDIETALLQHQPDAWAAACQALASAASAPPPLLRPKSGQPLLTEQEAVELDQKLKQLRQAILQQGAANDRMLAALLPSESIGGYGGKSSFGGVRRSTNLKSSYEV